MSTVAQTIAERYSEGRAFGKDSGEVGSLIDVLKNLGLMLLTPFIGLGFAVAYCFIGAVAIVCYGLKALGVSCGLVRP